MADRLELRGAPVPARRAVGVGLQVRGAVRVGGELAQAPHGARRPWAAGGRAREQAVQQLPRLSGSLELGFGVRLKWRRAAEQAVALAPQTQVGRRQQDIAGLG